MTEHGLLFMVSGYAGTGKTWLLRAIGERMITASTVCFATADEFEKEIPYSFIERLLSTCAAPFPIIDPTRPPMEIAREILLGLMDKGDGRLRTIIVDDAQWIDIESRLVLRYIVPRVMRQGLFIVVAGRLPDMDSTAMTFFADLAESTPGGITKVLEPLSVEEIRALAVDVLGASISPFTAETLRNSTGGSFLGIDSIFRRITPQERNKLHLLWDIPIRGVEPARNPLLGPFHTLPPAAKAAVEIVCCAGPETRPTTVAEVADRLGEDVEIGPAVAASVLTESGFGSTVSPRHSLIAHAVRQMLPRARAQAIYRALAPSAQGFRRMWYSLSGAAEWSPELAEAVREFIDDAVVRRSYATINDVLRRSLDLATGSDRDALLIRLGLINMEKKTVYSLFDLAPEFEALPETPVRECIMLTIMAYRKDQEFPRARLAKFLALEHTDADVRTLQAYAGFLSVVEVIRSQDYDQLPAVVAEAKAIIARGPETPEEVSDPALAWMVAPGPVLVLLDTLTMLQSVVVSDAVTVSGMLDDLVPQVLALPPSPHKVDALTPLAIVAMMIGEINRSRSLAETAVDLLEQVGRTWGEGTVRLIHAHTTSLLGSLDEAAELVELVTESSGSTIDVETRLPLSGLQAWVNAVRGVPDFIDLDAQTDRQTSLAWQPYAADMIVNAECERARAAGDPQGVIDASAPHRVRSLVGTQRGFLNYRTHALIDLERLGEAAELIGTLIDKRGRGWQPYWGSLEWAQARLLSGFLGTAWAGSEEARAGVERAGLSPDRIGAEEVARLFDEAVGDDRFPLPHALTLRDYGMFLIAEGQRARARTMLERSLATVRRIGAAAYLPSIRDVLGSVSQAERDLLSSLTAREREISRLLAQGRSNQEIAAELFVAPATVRYHVSNVLRKLELSRRSQVAAVFHESGIAVGD
ncbi:LuxR C-terminal-related transcriptional regulator [Brevibacterium casei]|uniref:LuxR C-terminal-related transcriptional regulator n=1 Tax=Brevibacterium casei TaxID=33889 RepID=UPI002469033D|nr:LuxR C-terminal-related transcriptional regulator [Brevibacterium casei]MDH5149797.1 LuxR C-terminal-related transcriptional regulator [Brevibacterium casei]